MTTDKGDAWYVANAKKNNFSCFVKTHASKSAPFADQDYDYVPNYTTHVDHITCVGVSGSTAKPITPVTPSAPTKPWDAAAVAEAVKTQVACFGKVSYGVAGCTTVKKAQLKAAALDKSLNAAFAPKIELTDALYLNPVLDGAWSPVTPDPLEELIAAETECIDKIDIIKKCLTPDEFEMVVAKSNGKTKTQIAQALGVSHVAIVKRFKKIQKKVDLAFGVPNPGYVAC